MSDTIKLMDYVKIDLLTPGQLMEGDLIEVEGEIVEVLTIESDSTGDNYQVEHQNSFGEKDFTSFVYTDLIELYMYAYNDEDE